MSEVDSLEVSIETTAKDTEKALDGLIKKLEIVAQGISAIKNNSGLEDFRKQVQELSKSDVYYKWMSIIILLLQWQIRFCSIDTESKMSILQKLTPQPAATSQYSPKSLQR